MRCFCSTSIGKCLRLFRVISFPARKMLDAAKSVFHSYRGQMVAVLLIGALIFITYTSISFKRELSDQTRPVRPFDWGTFKSIFDSRPRRLASNSHNDTSAVAKVRLLCVILTMEKDLLTKAAAVNNTWVRKCDKHFFVLSTKRIQDDFLSLDIPDSRTNLASKMRKTYEIIHDSYMDEFDWILKADDDTYVVVENLKLLLSKYNPHEPGYLGYHFNHFIKSGYMSGGAGYVISNSALRQMVEDGYRQNKCVLQNRQEDNEKSEDVDTGACLSAVNVPVLSSLDIEGRETFHPYPLEKHLLGNLPGYIYSWAKNYPVAGEKCCSRYVISFHYMSPGSVYLIDFLLYKTSVFGVEDPVVDDSSTIFRIGKIN